MKRICFLLLGVMIVFCLAALPAMGQNRSIYYSTATQNIITRIGMTTIVFFSVEIESTFQGNENAFEIRTDNKLDKLIITPMKVNAFTNLTVVTKDQLIYTFYLYELSDSKFDFDNTITVKPVVDLKPKTLINLVNRPLMDVEWDFKSLISRYEFGANEYTVSNLNVTVNIKRAAIVENFNRTILWLRINNNTYLGTGVDLYIPVNSIKIKEHEPWVVGIEGNKEKFKPYEYTDVYIILDGMFMDNSYTLMMNINNKDQVCQLANLPYKKQDIKLYNAVDKSYDTCVLENYQR